MEKIVKLDEKFRNQAIELTNQFFRQVNKMQLDGVFKIKPRAAAKFVDIYLKLAGTDKIVFAGVVHEDELLSLIVARIEEKPYLEEEKILYIDLAVTKKGKEKKGYMNRLVDYTEQWAREHGIRSIELRAIAENKTAMEFWNKRGYCGFYVRFRKNV